MEVSTTIGRAVHSILPTIRRIAERIDRINADDLTQDVALKLLISAPELHKLQRSAWLNKVVRHVAIDRWRQEEREAKYLDRTVTLDISGSVCEGKDGIGWYTPVSVQPDDMEIFLIPTIREKLQELPIHQRRALVLHSAGFTYLEIAELTGTTAGTVRSRIHYARKRAQKLLARIVR